MDKIEETFIGFLFSLKNILLTLIVNFVILGFYYILLRDGIDSFYFDRAVVVVLTIMATAIYMAFWFLSYRTFKKKKNENISINK